MTEAVRIEGRQTSRLKGLRENFSGSIRVCPMPSGDAYRLKSTLRIAFDQRRRKQRVIVSPDMAISQFRNPILHDLLRAARYREKRGAHVFAVLGPHLAWILVHQTL